MAVRPSGAAQDQQAPRHPSAFEPVTLFLTVALSVLGAIIGLNLITTLGISANTSVIGALVAMLAGRVSFAGLRKMRNIQRQNLVQSAVSGATFAAANSLITPIAVPWAMGQPDLVWPMLIGATCGLLTDTWVLYRTYDSKLFPAQGAWPPGVAAAETIKAGDKGGKRALILVGGAVAGFVGSLFKLPVSAGGVALIGNVWALGMFGLGLFLAQYTPGWFGVNLNAEYIPAGVMIGAGLVALGQAVWLLSRRHQGSAAAPGAVPEHGGPDDPALELTVNETRLRRGLLEGFVLFIGGAVLIGVLGGVIADMSPLAFAGWVLFAAFAALVHELIVGLAAMHSGWFPAFAVTLIFLVIGLLIGIPAIPLALLVGFCSSTGPAFADMGYDYKAGWILRREVRPWKPFEIAGRQQQYASQLVGFAVALVAVAFTWQYFFGAGLIPPVAKVYATTIQAGLTNPDIIRNLIIWAVPGALIQFVGGPKRQMGVLLATGLLVAAVNAWWLVIGALGVRLVWRRIRGTERGDEEMALVGAGVIAGGALADTSRVIRG